MTTENNPIEQEEKKIDFHSFQFEPTLLEGLEVLGFNNPTPIQSQAIPIVMANRDLIGCAQTGTGKTAAFLLPVMNKIIRDKSKGINTLIIVPTRELAVQIDQAVEGLAYFTGISSIAIYGGGDGITWDIQRNALESGADIVIATPGRFMSLLQSGKYNFIDLKHLVLDEADRMLDMGFYDDIVKIVSQLPKERQTLMFSATMPPRIRKLAETILNNPASISISISRPAEKIQQLVYRVAEHNKTALALHILQQYEDSTVIIFGSTKEKVRRFFSGLQSRGYNAATIHSDLEQSEREKTMNLFKNNQIRILVGTDIISRGIDVEGIGLVLNLDVPPDPEDYVHRVGRTARADNSGTAITFITRDDERKMIKIEQMIGKKIVVVPLPESIENDEPTQSKRQSTSSRPPNKKRFGQNKYNKSRRPDDKPEG
jgi:ATP-dependent RNA helicase RhlE